MVGLRWTFGGTSQRAAAAAKPKVQQAATPIPATSQTTATPSQTAALTKAALLPTNRSFILFFDFDKANITGRARQVIEKAAASTRSGGVAQIKLIGHADRAGPERYNMGLSVRRATAVKLELMGLGIPESEIVVAGKGENQPLVATRDGVQEPQNRRVEVTF